MPYDQVIQDAEKEFEDFTLDDEDDDEPEVLGENAFHCRDAYLFYTWCSHILDKLHQNPTEVWIDTYELHLQRRYWEYLKRSPSECGNYRAEPGEAKCIKDVWFETFSAMEDLRMSQQPHVFKEIVKVEVQKVEEEVTIAGTHLFNR